MKALRNRLVALIAVALAAGLVFNYSGCSKQSPTGPFGNDDDSGSVYTLHKGGQSIVAFDEAGNQDSLVSCVAERWGWTWNSYPQYAEVTLRYDRQVLAYSGGSMKVANGSQFVVRGEALTAPEGTPVGEPMTLTMLVEKSVDGVRKELLYTFGPTGCRFDPPARVWFSWRSLGGCTAKVYYINPQGNYIEQHPIEIDRGRKRILVEVDHFSRYAVAHSQ